MSNHANVLNAKLVSLSRENTPAKHPLPRRTDLMNLSDGFDSPVLTTYVSPSLISPHGYKPPTELGTHDTTESSADFSDSGQTPGVLKPGETHPTNPSYKPYQAQKSTSFRHKKRPSDIVLELKHNREELSDSPSTPPVKSDKRSMSLGEDIREGFLKKSSSFAGFTEENIDPFQRQDSLASLLASPVKNYSDTSKLPSLGRLRHSSAPSGGQRLPAPTSKQSTLPQTPSYFSSRGSYTDIGNTTISLSWVVVRTSFSDFSFLILSN